MGSEPDRCRPGLPVAVHGDGLQILVNANREEYEDTHDMFTAVCGDLIAPHGVTAYAFGFMLSTMRNFTLPDFMRW